MSTVTGSGRLYGLKLVAEVPEIAYIVVAGMWYSGDMSLWASDDYSSWHEVLSGATLGISGGGGAIACPPGDIRHRFWQFRLSHLYGATYWSAAIINYFRLIQADHTDLLHLQDGTPWPVGLHASVGSVVPYVATMWQSVGPEFGRSLQIWRNGVAVAGTYGGTSTYGPITGDQIGSGNKMGIQGPLLAAGGCTATWTFDIAVDPTIPPEGVPGQPPMRLHGVVGV